MKGKFRKLEVWQEAMNLAIQSRDVYKILLESRDFGLADQLTRAVNSVPANIAEGAECGSAPQFRRYLNVAIGSVAEFRTHLELSYHFNAIQKDQFEKLDNQAARVAARLYGLKKYLTSQIS